ncbi:Arginine exporter protein ArgO [Corynebacterium ciconiae DSM 44920]|uniref:LysE/ArgO family amino acid transporter n=1 Tax=Corynebacterium ciconiae TaxID=227319 RepID=UPI00035CA109|nr:LysE family transporter [Corynebacterium ciconiae]WKD61033.1 Arginine exporter protein ArgO [Corynebacterium ciconiae DSM 44920]
MIALNGFFVGLSLIIAIGPQNALLLKQGVKGVAVGAVVAVCLISDILLILGGTAGMGVLVEKAPTALVALKWAGVVYLSYFAYTCFRDALAPKAGALRATDVRDPEEIDLDGDATTHQPSEIIAEAEALQNTAIHNGDSSEDTRVSSTATAPGGALATKRRNRITTSDKPWLKPVIAALVFTWFNPAAYIDTLVMLGGLANQFGPTGRWEFSAGALAASALWFPAIGFGARALAQPLSKPQNWRRLNFAIGVVMLIITARLALH